MKKYEIKNGAICGAILCGLAALAPICGANAAIKLGESAIPDKKLAECVLEAFRKAEGGDNKAEKITDVDPSVIYSLSCSSKGVAKIDGLEYLSNLKNIDLSGNELETADLTPFALLNTANFSNNKLTSINIDGLGELTNLNLAGNAFEELEIWSEKLATLDVSNNGSLKYLDVSEGILTSLKLDNSTKLEEIYAYDNKLSDIDVTTLPKLKYLYVENNKLSSINVSKNDKLEFLCVSNNILTKIDVTSNDNLVELDVSSNKLSVIDVTRNEDLEHLNVSDNWFDTINVDDNEKLEMLGAKGMIVLISAKPELKDKKYILDLNDYKFLGTYNTPKESENYIYEDGVFTISTEEKLNAMGGVIEYESINAEEFVFTVKFGVEPSNPIPVPDTAGEIEDEDEDEDSPKTPDTGVNTEEMKSVAMKLTFVGMPIALIVGYMAKYIYNRMSKRVKFSKR